jgi:hypothetical protein
MEVDEPSFGAILAATMGGFTGAQDPDGLYFVVLTFDEFPYDPEGQPWTFVSTQLDLAPQPHESAAVLAEAA